MKSISFFQLRYWLIGNVLGVNLNESEKNSLFVNAFLKPQTVQIGNKKYKIKILQQSGPYYLGQFGRDRISTHPVDKGTKIVVEDIDDTPFVYFFVVAIAGLQHIFVQRDLGRGIYSNNVSRLLKILQGITSTYGLTQLDISFQYLPSETTFWEAVQQFDKVMNVEFQLPTPNFMGAEDEMDELLRSAKSNVNANQIKLAYENDQGLNLTHGAEFIGQQVEHTEKVSGSWTIKGYKGEARLIRHKEDFARTRSVSYDEDIPEDNHQFLDLLISNLG